MGDLEVFQPCDRCGPFTRAGEVWTKEACSCHGQPILLTLCMHHADKAAVALQAQGFNPLESEVLTR